MIRHHIVSGFHIITDDLSGGSFIAYRARKDKTAPIVTFGHGNTRNEAVYDLLKKLGRKEIKP